jgi:uncharacterized Zn finger protein (UPF0148 family)
MSKAEKDGLRQAAELLRKGATLMGAPCKQCGGIQVSYHGRVYCTGHEDLSVAITTERVSFDMVVAEMREVLLAKLSQASALLESEKGTVGQDQLVSLMSKYFDLLQRLPQKQHTP